MKLTSLSFGAPALSLGLLLLSSTAAAAPRVEDNGVIYIGTDAKGIESFLNIRYGQDTGKENRFKRPFPYTYPKDAVVDAARPGDACPQQLGNPLPQFTGLFGNASTISEDCLTVRIDRPLNTPADAQLPVLVFLHGGGYAFGHAYDETAYNPVGLVRENGKKGLPHVYVAINYRVGAFGFAASDALREEDNLNVGLLDQRLALQWVQEHIAAFGGNKDDVTIFGENVGWASVELQLTAYGGTQDKAPFNRAILMSGPTLAGDALTAGLSDKHTTSLTESLKCASPSGDSAEELECLRSTPLHTLVDAAVNISLAFMPLGGMGTFRPTAPSSFIPDAPSSLLAEGRFQRGIDIVVGWNENDGTQWVPATINSTAAFTATLRTFFPDLSLANTAQLRSLYAESDFSDLPKENINRNYFRAAQAIRDAQFTCPSLRVAEAWGRHAPEQNSYVYSLNQTVFRVGHDRVGRSHVGTDHFSDIPYVFVYVDNAEFSLVADQSDYDMASHISGSWSSFAHYGQPTVPGLSVEQLTQKNLTYGGWNRAFLDGVDSIDLRVLGGPHDGMATIPLNADAEEGVSGVLYDEQLAERCGFWSRPDVLAQTWA